jgi:hypothetical protein
VTQNKGRIKVKVQITEHDMHDAARNGLDNPYTRAINRVAGGNWFVHPPLACEMTAPHRATSLPYEVSRNIKHFIATGTCELYDFEVDVQPVRGYHLCRGNGDNE